MTLSRESLEILLDLIEIKMNALQIHDKDEARDINKLRKCRQELLSSFGSQPLTAGGPGSPLPKKIHDKHKPIESSH